MHLTDMLWPGVLLQSIGILGAAYARGHAAEPLPTRDGLRTLRPEEEGSNFAALPAGVYGFTYAALSETPLFARHSYHSFEVHKKPDGAGVLIAYVTPAEAEAIAKGGELLEIGVYPAEYGEAKVPVALPFDRISPRHRNPIREDGNRIALIIRLQGT